MANNQTQHEVDYQRIASAISFLREHYRDQPGLEELAAHVHVSPFHFQRMFQTWAGVSPKQFLQYISIGHAKKILKQTRATLFDVASDTGLSGTGRLHDLFMNIEGMTPGEYKNGGEALHINYAFAGSPFGNILVASTEKGICYMAFADEESAEALTKLKQTFPKATYTNQSDQNQQNALFVFNQDWNKLDDIKLHLKGTAFQLKVWETLLKIPVGGLTTYADLAARSGYERAHRAVGTAIGKNPVAFLIPCHRVIRSTGEMGNYHWNPTRKHLLIGWEASGTQV